MEKQIKEKLNEIILLSSSITDTGNNKGSFFSSGLAGTVFLISQYKIDFETNEYDELLKEKIEEFISIDLTQKNITYCEGITGYAWLLDYLIKNQIIDLDVTNFLADVDFLAYQSSLNQLKFNNHDFLHGAIGNLYYLTERIDCENVKLYIKEIIIELNKQAFKSEKGLYWIKNDGEKELVDLGLSHGLASKIVIFSKLIKKGILTDLLGEMLYESVRFIMNSKNVDQTKSVFPGSFILGERDLDISCGVRWCYGDLGISFALIQAAQVMNNSILRDEAIDICLKNTLLKEESDTLIKGVDICHGASGAAHLYNRMYYYSKDERFKHASNFWIKKTIDMSSGEKELAGYEKQYRDFPDSNFGFLIGLSGVGLVLLSAISNKEPIWDSCLLIS